jgi:glycosyltransferase involved in cell wall biosynthesis
MSSREGRPRVLFVGRNRYRLPLPGWLARKWDAVERELDFRVLGSAEPGSNGSDRRFLLAPPGPGPLDGVLFHARLPFRISRELRRRPPDAIVAADPFTAASAIAGRTLSRRRVPLVVEVHGDWRTFARLYGSPARRALAPLADALARFSLRRADSTRALSRFTSGLVADVRGEEATASFPTYSDLSAFTSEPVRPLPERPTAVFVGMLEAYKNVEGLAAAWRRVARELPVARLVIVGKGRQRAVVDALVRDLPGQVEHLPELAPDEVARRLDEATVLVLPSWPEGLGRVVIEAFARGRGAVATDAGGIPDLVTDGREGLLIPPGDTEALAAALIRVLSDRALAKRLGEAARERYADWHSTPERFAAELRALVDATIAAAR